jgi:hypothetical protein
MFFDDGKDHFEKHCIPSSLDLVKASFKNVFTKKFINDDEKKEQRTTIVTHVETLFDPALAPPPPYKDIPTVNQVFNFVFTKLCQNISDPKKFSLMKVWKATYKESMCPSEDHWGGEEWNVYLDKVDAFFSMSARIHRI